MTGRSFVMYEEDWIKLCAKQCKARQKQWGPDPDYCDEHNGICPECADDAAARVPKKYHTTPEEAARHDRLPGC